MDTAEPQALFASIGSYLRSCREGAADAPCRRYWQGQSCISAAEIGMIAGMGTRAHCVEALAEMLGREAGWTRELLAALAAVGVLERVGERYAATPAARTYCWAVTEGCSPAE